MCSASTGRSSSASAAAKCLVVGVEAPAGHDFDAKGIADAPQLGGHATGFAYHDQPGLLPKGAVEPELSGLIFTVSRNSSADAQE